jgi:hypothetical protein
MTRFAWLQSRAQTLTVLGLLAALAVTAAITGVQLSHLYNDLVAHCQTGCDLATAQFLSHDQFLDRSFTILSRLAPALIGIFWGAPLLAREIETGSYRLAWTQSVTRRRWLVTKLGLVGLTAVTVAGLLTLTITWWSRAIDTVGGNQYELFDRRGIAPIGYAAFAFATGALLGVVIRRTVPAMATTLAVFVFARVATALWIRPHLLSPLHKTMSLTTGGEFGFASTNGSSVALIASGSGPPKSWTLSSQIVTNTGHPATAAERVNFLRQYCPIVANPPDRGSPQVNHPVAVVNSAAEACSSLAARTFHLVITYQPADRYWTFQWLETGIFLAAAILAAVGCFWWVTHRTA